MPICYLRQGFISTDFRQVDQLYRNLKLFLLVFLSKFWFPPGVLRKFWIISWILLPKATFSFINCILVFAMYLPLFQYAAHCWTYFSFFVNDFPGLPKPWVLSFYLDYWSFHPEVFLARSQKKTELSRSHDVLIPSLSTIWQLRADKE